MQRLPGQIKEMPAHMTESVYTQGCRFDTVCKQKGDFNPASTSHCSHNGGVDCPKWRHLTDEAIGKRKW